MVNDAPMVDEGKFVILDKNVDIITINDLITIFETISFFVTFTILDIYTNIIKW